MSSLIRHSERARKLRRMDITITQCVMCVVGIICVLGFFLSWNVLDQVAREHGDVHGLYMLMIAFGSGFVCNVIAIAILAVDRYLKGNQI